MWFGRRKRSNWAALNSPLEFFTFPNSDHLIWIVVFCTGGVEWSSSFMPVYTGNIICNGNVRKRKHKHQWHFLLISNRIDGRILLPFGWNSNWPVFKFVSLQIMQQRQSNLTAEEEVSQPSITITEGQPVNNCTGCKFLWYALHYLLGLK